MTKVRELLAKIEKDLKVKQTKEMGNLKKDFISQNKFWKKLKTNLIKNKIKNKEIRMRVYHQQGSYVMSLHSKRFNQLNQIDFHNHENYY